MLIFNNIFDNKRQQTTANDYCRLQTFNQRIGFDRFGFFAARNIKPSSLWKYLNLFMASQPRKAKVKNA
jgi:hypothetical protein